jgi:hypothetical protein
VATGLWNALVWALLAAGRPRRAPQPAEPPAPLTGAREPAAV